MSNRWGAKDWLGAVAVLLIVTVIQPWSRNWAPHWFVWKRTLVVALIVGVGAVLIVLAAPDDTDEAIALGFGGAGAIVIAASYVKGLEDFRSRRLQEIGVIAVAVGAASASLALMVPESVGIFLELDVLGWSVLTLFLMVVALLTVAGLLARHDRKRLTSVDLAQGETPSDGQG